MNNQILAYNKLIVKWWNAKSSLIIIIIKYTNEIPSYNELCI